MSAARREGPAGAGSRKRARQAVPESTKCANADAAGETLPPRPAASLLLLATPGASHTCAGLCVAAGRKCPTRALQLGHPTRKRNRKSRRRVQQTILIKCHKHPLVLLLCRGRDSDSIDNVQFTRPQQLTGHFIQPSVRNDARDHLAQILLDTGKRFMSVDVQVRNLLLEPRDVTLPQSRPRPVHPFAPLPGPISVTRAFRQRLALYMLEKGLVHTSSSTGVHLPPSLQVL